MINKYTFATFIFIASFGLAVNVSALSPTVYVDANYTESNTDGHTFGVDAFATLQNAIDAVADDGIIYVKKGLYNEAVTITKSLSMSGFVEHTSTGASDDSPVIDGKGATATILIQGSSTPIRV